MRTIAGSVAVYAVKRDVFTGWTASPEPADAAAFRAARVPVRAPTVLVNALGVEGARLGRIHASDPIAPHAGTARDFEVAVIAVRIEERAALVVLAGELGDPLASTRRMEEVARAAGDALERVLRTRRSRP
jgi:hypothetical protein